MAALISEEANRNWKSLVVFTSRQPTKIYDSENS